MPIRIVISGATGRMGQTLVRLIADDERFKLMGGIATKSLAEAEAQTRALPKVENSQTAGPLIRSADVIIDFSAAAALRALLSSHAAALDGKGIVIGTTGLTDDDQQLIAQAAQHSAIVAAANFSVAVNVLLGLVETTARVLDAEHYDVEIVEAHHKRKVDAPSGTALALAQAIAAARKVALESVHKHGRSGNVGARPVGEIGIHAVRGGEVVGEHRVQFLGSRDRLELAHVAQDRGLFAEGALRAAEWVHAQSPGRYTMAQVLGLAQAGTTSRG